MPSLRFNEIVTKSLLQRFELEADHDGGEAFRYYGCILRDDGDLCVHHPAAPAVDSMQLVWAGRTLKFLNRELHFDGAWVVVFTNPSKISFESAAHAEPRSCYYRRFCLIWLDKDADPQFSVEWLHGDAPSMKDFAAVALAGPEVIAQMCAEARGLWGVSQEVLELKGGEQYRRAKGEKAPSAA